MKKSKNGVGTFQTVISAIVTIALFVFIIIISSTTINFQFEVNIYFYANLIGGTIIIIFAFVIWTPTGESKGLAQEKYINGKNEYDRQANYIVRHQMFAQLDEFCEKKNEKIKKEIITDKLSTQVIPYRIYELKVKLDKTEEEQEELTKLWNRLNPKQKKLVNEIIEKGVKFEKLVPKNVTIGSVSKHSVVNHNGEKGYKMGRMLMKSTWGIGTTFFTYFVVIAPADDFGYKQIIMIIMWLFTFLTTISNAYMTGYKSITVHRHKYNIEQAELCSEFLADCNVSPEMVNKDENGQKDN